MPEEDPQNGKEEKKELPEGCAPKYLNMKTQEQYELLGLNAENPHKFINKAVLLANIQNHGVIDDFHSLKDQIQAFTGEELLIVLDPEENFWDPIYEQDANFFVCFTQDAIDKEVKKYQPEPDPTPEESTEEGEEVWAPDLKQYEVKHAPVSESWKSLGSEREVENMTVKDSRPLISVHLARPRREFGGRYKFSDREANDALYEMRPFKDPQFESEKIEVDAAVQAIPITTDTSAQTEWRRPVHFTAQYQAPFFPEDERKRIEESPQVAQFLEKIRPQYEVALQQNASMNVFKDDYGDLYGDDTAIGTKADNTLKEEQPFTDIEHSKGKLIAAIDAMPQTQGVIAVSCASRVSFSERIEESGRAHPAVILIWNFLDPIHPQYVLETPCDVPCFKFNPVQPSILVGGAQTGQVVLWDLSNIASALYSQQSRGDELDRRKVRDRGASNTIKHSCVSSIPLSHHVAISDLQWLPPQLVLDTGKKTQGSEPCRQFATVSLDGTVLFWDIAFMQPMKELDLNWAPFHRLEIRRPSLKKEKEESGDEEDETRLSLAPAQNSLMALQRLVLGENEFLCTTEDGEILQCDYDKGLKKVIETNRGGMPAIERSPTFSDVFLCVGDWNFSIWREGCDTPMLISPFTSTFLTCVKWSPTRSGVFFIGRGDGVVEVWDLADRSHEPSLCQTVSASSITSLQFAKTPGTRRAHEVYMLMVGDDQGVVHPMEIPRNFSRSMPQEKSSMEAFYDREINRIKTTGERTTHMKKWVAAGKEVKDPEEAELSEETKRQKQILLSQDREAAYRALEASYRKKFGLEAPPSPNSDE